MYESKRKQTLGYEMDDLILAEQYLLGTMMTGTPKASFMNFWDGILQRLMHIPTQLDSSRNL